MTVVAIKAPVIVRSRSPSTLIVPNSTFVAPPKTLLGTSLASIFPILLDDRVLTINKGHCFLI